MGITLRKAKPAPSVVEVLQDKPSELTNTANEKYAEAQALAAIAARARAEAEEADRHAAAVEQALAILVEAGVRV